MIISGTKLRILKELVRKTGMVQDDQILPVLLYGRKHWNLVFHILNIVHIVLVLTKEQIGKMVNGKRTERKTVRIQ